MKKVPRRGDQLLSNVANRSIKIRNINSLLDLVSSGSLTMIRALSLERQSKDLFGVDPRANGRTGRSRYGHHL